LERKSGGGESPPPPEVVWNWDGDLNRRRSY